MPVGDVETFAVDGRWANRFAGEKHGPNTSYEHLEDAVRVGRDLARGRQVDHVVLDADGSELERTSSAGAPDALAG